MGNSHNMYNTNALSTHLKALFFNKYFMTSTKTQLDPSPLLIPGYHKEIQNRSKQMIC